VSLHWSAVAPLPPKDQVPSLSQKGRFPKMGGLFLTLLSLLFKDFQNWIELEIYT